MIIEPASTSQSIDVQIVDDAGLAVTGLVAATFPAVKWSLAGNTAAVAITLSDLALITTAWVSGGVKERSGGFYRLDLPDAALGAAGTVTLIGDASGKHLLAEPIIVATPASLASIGSTARTSLSLSIEIRVGGVLTDADAPPVMSDRTNAFGVRRADTLAVVVATGKQFAHDGTGLYSYALDGSDADHPQALAGVTYEYWPKFTVAGTPLNYQRTKLASAKAASWYYGQQSDVEGTIGVLNTAIASNKEALTVSADTAAIQRAGDLSDQWIDARLDALGFPAPLLKPLAMRDARILADISAWLVVWQLKQWRLIQVSAKSAAALDKGIGSMRAMALATLDRIGLGLIKLIAVRGAWYSADPVAIGPQGAVGNCSQAACAEWPWPAQLGPAPGWWDGWPN